MPHITVCICTFKRPDLLIDLLEHLNAQVTRDKFTFSVAILDNDVEGSAENAVQSFSERSILKVTYSIEPVQNIARARNRTLEMATGEYYAFIDDDETPDPGWLLLMFNAVLECGVHGVLGPVEPRFESPPPQWVIKGGFFRRPRHTTGEILDWKNTRTGNALVSAAISKAGDIYFREEFGRGGEDRDFFRRAIEKGYRFAWCDEAVVYELIPRERWNRRFLLKRALVRGRMSLRHPGNRVSGILKSMVAVFLYTAILPLMLIAGHHLFMKFLIKDFDHMGKLLALLGIDPVKEQYVMKQGPSTEE